MISTRVATAAVIGLAGVMAVAPGCTKTEDVTFVVRLPAEVRDSVQWLEVGAYAAPNCPSIAQLSGGLPRGGLVRRVGFQNGSNAPVFRVDKGTYAFAATARNTQCEVLAGGCTAIEVPGNSEITINMKPATVKGGKCLAGSSCRDGECVLSPTSDTIGAGCTLEVVGAGPLESLQTSGNAVSKPAIAAVADGFVVGYAQQAGNVYRVTTMKVGFDGGPIPADPSTSLPFNRYGIQGSCADDADTRGLGLFFDRPTAQSGLVILPRSPVCVREAMTIYQIQQDGHFVSAAGAAPVFEDNYRKHVMSNHPLAAGGFLVHVIDDQAYLRTVTAAGFSPDPPSPIGGNPPHLDAWVASSQQAVATLVLAGSSSGSADPDSGVASSDGELRLQVASLTDATRTLSDPIPIASRFGALAMSGTRVFVLSSGELTSPVQINMLNVGDVAPTQGPPVQVTGEGKTLAADLAVDGERMYIASVLTNGVNVAAFGTIFQAPTLLKERQLAREARVKQFMGGIFDELRDGYVAIAANGARVGVVWMTGDRVSAGEELGGWAVLACR